MDREPSDRCRKPALYVEVVALVVVDISLFGLFTLVVMRRDPT